MVVVVLADMVALDTGLVHADTCDLAASVDG